MCIHPRDAHVRSQHVVRQGIAQQGSLKCRDLVCLLTQGVPLIPETQVLYPCFRGLGVLHNHVQNNIKHNSSHPTSVARPTHTTLPLNPTNTLIHGVHLNQTKREFVT